MPQDVYRDRINVMKILDCTLRDGGYYTAWDFDKSIAEVYADAMDRLPVDCIEVGYRSNPAKDYLGQFGYTPVSTLQAIRARCKKKIAVMLNEKITRIEDLDRLLVPVKGLVDVVRLAVDPNNFERAISLSKAVKSLGFVVSFNMMYMSTWRKRAGLMPKLASLDGCIDILCMVDSFGGIAPEELKAIVQEVRLNTNVPIGFHGHNNLQMGLINTLTAMECGAESVDATILGMGRGAGNLKMELLLTYLNRHHGLDVDFNTLGDVITAFEPLRKRYGWGTSLPYMLSGANDIPQKEVMEWVSNRVYSFNSIVRALDNRRNKVADNARFPVFSPDRRYDGVVVVGGGESAHVHAGAVRQYLLVNPNIAIVFATARQAKDYLDIPNDHYYCLAGNESRRIKQIVGDKATEGIGILPPYPREMGTEVLPCMMERTFELAGINFEKTHRNSVTALALQLAMQLTTGDVWLIGYDGYPGQVLSEKEIALSRENQAIFTSYAKCAGKPLVSLSLSLYSELQVESIYQFI